MLSPSVDLTESKTRRSIPTDSPANCLPATSPSLESELITVMSPIWA